MSVRKILLDYSEYERLKHIEEKYAELLSKHEKQGSGDNANLSSIVQSQKDQTSVQQPLIGHLPSITMPPSAEMTKSKKSGDNFAKAKVKAPRKWYYIGVPQN